MNPSAIKKRRQPENAIDKTNRLGDYRRLMIVICEPHFRGARHAQFNAALVGSVIEAFPEEELIFCAERGHMNHVKRMVDAHVAAIRFIEVGLVDRSVPNEQRGRRLPLARSLEQLALYRRIFGLADNNQASQIVFCSTTHWTSLVLIKVMLRRFPQIPCLVVLHNLQTLVSTPQPKRLTPQLFSYRHWLLAGNTAKIHYLIPGPPPIIEQGVQKYLPRLYNLVSPIDPPRVFADAVGSEPFKDDIIHFGFFGHASLRKGADTFFKLADEVSAARTKYPPIFVLVGDILDEQLKEMPHTSVNIPSPNALLSQEEYDKYGKCIDYALFFHLASAYELNGTAVIMDAFSFLKPIIALKTPLSEYYFDKMGDVGYLCESYSDMKNTVLEVLETKPIGRYRVQQDNILAKRGQFSPAGVAPKLRVLLEQKAH
jgi:hypothetical protein